MCGSFRIGGVLGAAMLAGAVSVPPGRAAERIPEKVTLRQVTEAARAGSPVLRARRAEVEQAEGRLVAARTYPHNPTIAFEAARRKDVGSTTDREVRLAQEIRIGGQPRRRVEVAAADLAVSRAALLREERLLEARVRAAWVEALRARELHDVEAVNAELARSLAEIARKRFESGAVAQMEVNLARVQVGRAERDRTLAAGAYEAALSALAAVASLDPSRPPEVVGELVLPTRRPIPLEELLRKASESRADLRSLRRTTQAAHARVELIRREAVPDLELAAFYGREDGNDRLFGGGVAMRIPLFNRNQGEIAEARAERRRIEAETSAGELRIRQEVASSLARYQASAEASKNLKRQVLGTLDENLRLLQRSFEAGKTGWADVLVFRREFVNIQRDYIDTVSDALLAEIELDLATGTAPVTAGQGVEP